MRRVAAFVLVVAVAAPSFAAVVCEWTCASAHAAPAAADTARCHDHTWSDEDAPALSSVHACHELVATPTLVKPPAPQLSSAPAPVLTHSSPGERADAHRRVVRSRPEPHDPPGHHTPLRI